MLCLFNIVKRFEHDKYEKSLYKNWLLLWLLLLEQITSMWSISKQEISPDTTFMKTYVSYWINLNRCNAYLFSSFFFSMNCITYWKKKKKKKNNGQFIPRLTFNSLEQKTLD